MDVTLDDVAGVISLVREVGDLWDDPPAWRAHLLRGACQLVNGHVGMAMEDDGSGKDGFFGNLWVTAVVGLPDEKQRLVQPAVSKLSQRNYDDVSDNVVAGVSSMWQLMQRQGWVTIARNQLVSETEYRASPFYQEFRKPIDCDDFLLSIRMVDLPRRPEGIVIDRPHGAPPFGPREVAILKLLHDEIAPLVGVRLTTEEHLSRDGLSRRLRETLSLLLEGHSEKQVAKELKLASRTVHEYVTTLYKHFSVSSRAELLAYFVRRRPAKRLLHAEVSPRMMQSQPGQ